MLSSSRQLLVTKGGGGRVQECGHSTRKYGVVRLSLESLDLNCDLVMMVKGILDNFGGR